MIVWLLNIYIDCLYGNRYIFLSFFFLYFLVSTFSLLSVHVFLFSYILSYRVIARSSISVFIGCVHFGHTSKRMQKYKSFANAKGERWTYKYGFLLRRRFMNEWKCWSERASVKEIDLVDLDASINRICFIFIMSILILISGDEQKWCQLCNCSFWYGQHGDRMWFYSVCSDNNRKMKQKQSRRNKCSLHKICEFTTGSPISRHLQRSTTF